MPKSRPMMVNLADLVCSAELQVRDKINLPTVKQYGQAIKAGTELPPLEVADCGGVLWLLDGYHRKAAFENCGQRRAPACIAKVDTLEEAAWLAAKANLTHGLRLRPAERRNAFRAFMDAGQNRQGVHSDGNLKSYRAIGRDLGGIAANTIRNWMRSEYPLVFSEMAGADDNLGGPGGLRASVTPDEAAFMEASYALDAVLAALPGVASPRGRAALLNKVDNVKAAIEWASSTDAATAFPF